MIFLLLLLPRSVQATTFTVVLSLASYALFTYLAYITEREYQEDFNSYVVTYFSVITLTRLVPRQRPASVLPCC